MTAHDIVIKAWHGVLASILPILVSDAWTVYRWLNGSDKTFAQTFDWKVALKKLAAGAIAGALGAFGLQAVGVSI